MRWEGRMKKGRRSRIKRSACLFLYLMQMVDDDYGCLYYATLALCLHRENLRLFHVLSWQHQNCNENYKTKENREKLPVLQPCSTQTNDETIQLQCVFWNSWALKVNWYNHDHINESVILTEVRLPQIQCCRGRTPICCFSFQNGQKFSLKPI